MDRIDDAQFYPETRAMTMATKKGNRLLFCPMTRAETRKQTEQVPFHETSQCFITPFLHGVRNHFLAGDVLLVRTATAGVVLFLPLLACATPAYFSSPA